MEKAVERGLMRRGTTERYVNLGIDEKSYHKRHKYATVLYADDGHIVDLVEGRTKASVKKLLTKSLTQEQRDGIKAVSMDMWEPFITGVTKYMPKALICHDHYHLVAYLNKAVDAVRRREVKHYEDLRKTRYLWLKDKMSYTDYERDRFDSIDKSSCITAKAWQIKEMFRAISFGSDSQFHSMQLWLWERRALRDNIPEINKIVEMFKAHEQGILNAMKTGVNNSKSENANGKIQKLITIGRGFRDFEHFRTNVLFFYGGLDLR